MTERLHDSEKVEGQKVAGKHPVGNFMWSVAVGSLDWNEYPLLKIPVFLGYSLPSM